MADTSVLIITYNRAEDTRSFLENISKQADLHAHILEILILNNASTTDYSLVESFIHNNPNIPFVYIPHHENLGVARGRNYLIQRAKGTQLIVLDDDMEFDDPHAIATIAGLLKKPEAVANQVALVTFGVFYYENKQRQLNALPHKHIQAYINKPWFLTYYFAGGAHVVYKKVFDDIGLYPEDFFYGMEEYDLSYRMIQHGYKLAYDDSVRVLHKESPLGRVTNAQKLGMMLYNKAKVAYRYLPKSYFYSTVVMWTFQFLKKTNMNFSAWKGIWQKIKTIPKTEKRRPLDNKALQYLRSVNARLWY